jgi:hypothetical protein
VNRRVEECLARKALAREDEADRDREGQARRDRPEGDLEAQQDDVDFFAREHQGAVKPSSSQVAREASLAR